MDSAEEQKSLDMVNEFMRIIDVCGGRMKDTRTIEGALDQLQAIASISAPEYRLREVYDTLRAHFDLILELERRYGTEAEVKVERDQYKETLTEIANEDYRGNRSPASEKAYHALQGVQQRGTSGATER